MGNFIGNNLPSYPNAGRRGIKVYSDAKIFRVKGYERLYQMFWNAKAGQVCADKQFSNWPKIAIHGVISSEWALKKNAFSGRARPKSARE